MNFQELVKNRYSCKKFSTKEVEAEKLTAVLESGRVAPTAKNLQEQRVYVLQSPDALAAFDAASPCRYGAPTVLVVAYDKTNVFTYPGGKYNSGEDATIVATHLLLGAASEGLDSCWINFFDPDKLAEALELPENEEIVMALDLGYAAEGAGPLANHSSRKPLVETVVYR